MICSHKNSQDEISGKNKILLFILNVSLVSRSFITVQVFLEQSGNFKINLRSFEHNLKDLEKLPKNDTSSKHNLKDILTSFVY